MAAVNLPDKSECRKFVLPMGSEEFSLELDIERSRLLVDLSNPQRLIIRRKIISKSEEIRHITGMTLSIDTLSLISDTCNLYRSI